MKKKTMKNANLRDLSELVYLTLEDIAEQLHTLNAEIVMLRAAWTSVTPATVETKTEEGEK